MPFHLFKNFKAKFFDTAVQHDTRTSIKTIADPNSEPEIEYSTPELEIIARFEKLPGNCKRKISRMQKGGPTNWSEFSTLIKQHEIGGHTHK